MLGRMPFAAVERARLADALLAVCPDAPTLCEGWTARDLACHLVLRERHLTAVPGMFLDSLASVTERAMNRQRQRPFDDVVAEWGSGPAGPWRLIDTKANVAEHFVHHEDVRRPQGMEPRRFSTPETAELYTALRGAAFGFRSSLALVELWPTGQLPIVTGDKRSACRVQIHGDVGELLLYAFGRPALGLDFVGDAKKVRSRAW